MDFLKNNVNLANSNFMLIFYNETSACIVFFMLYFVNIICTLPSELSLETDFYQITCSVSEISYGFSLYTEWVSVPDPYCTAYNNLFLAFVFCFF